MGKKEISIYREFCEERRFFVLRKGPKYLYRLFDVPSKHATSELETLQVQVYIKQRFHDERRTEFM